MLNLIRNKINYLVAKNANFEFECIVLNYHGLIESFSDSRLDRNFHLYSSFEEQIRFLYKRFDIISLQDLNYSISNNLPIKNKVIITFDDGYANNIFAREILDKINSNISFTVFISTGYIGTLDESIWTVNLSLLLLKGKRTEIYFEGEKFDLSTEQARNFNFNVIRSKLKSINARLRIEKYNEIIEQYDLGELRSLLKYFKQFKMLSWDECKNLAFNKTEIESHGFNHELLHSNQNIDFVNYEIGYSRQIIMNRLGKVVIGYAYPNGDYSDIAIDALRNDGYKLAFTTREGLYSTGDSIFKINRISPPNNINSFYKSISLYKI